MDDDFEEQSKPIRRTPAVKKASTGDVRSTAGSGRSSASAATTSASDGSSSVRGSGGSVKKERGSSRGGGGGVIDLTEEEEADEDEEADDEMEVDAGQAPAKEQALDGLDGALLALPGGPVDDEESSYLEDAEKREAFRRRVDDLSLPPNPLDEIIDRLGGVKAVAGNTYIAISPSQSYTLSPSQPYTLSPSQSYTLSPSHTCYSLHHSCLLPSHVTVFIVASFSFICYFSFYQQSLRVARSVWCARRTEPFATFVDQRMACRWTVKICTKRSFLWVIRSGWRSYRMLPVWGFHCRRISV